MQPNPGRSCAVSGPSPGVLQRGLSQLDFVDYSIGNWECKCGNLKGLNHLRTPCRSCGTSLEGSGVGHPHEILKPPPSLHLSCSVAGVADVLGSLPSEKVAIKFG